MGKNFARHSNYILGGVLDRRAAGIAEVTFEEIAAGTSGAISKKNFWSIFLGNFWKNCR